MNLLGFRTAIEVAEKAPPSSGRVMLMVMVVIAVGSSGFISGAWNELFIISYTGS